MLSSSATANDRRVTRNVMANTRTGIAIQRRPVSLFSMLLSYTSCRLPVPSCPRTSTGLLGTGDQVPGTGLYATIQTMSQASTTITRSPADIVRMSPVSQAANGICYARSGEITISENDLDRMVSAVPVAAAAALSRKAYYFVPLTVSQGDDTVIADRYDVALSDNAVCHRNLNLGDAQCVFISTRLMDDKFSVAFEFYINVGHALVEQAGVSQSFAEMVWQQAESGVRGETSLDAWESRKLATVSGPEAEKYKNEYLTATFAD